MSYKYEGLVDNEFVNTASTNEEGSNKTLESDDTNLNHIYGKIVKIRKELEKSYNLFYSYNMIVSNKGENYGSNNFNNNHNSTSTISNNAVNTYSNLYKRNDGMMNTNKSTKDNLTLNKINALTNSFFMNIEILKNTHNFIKTNNMNNQCINNEHVIWERRIETLSKEADSYIKTLDTIYKNNLNQSEINKNKTTHKGSKKKNIEDEINYLHNEKEVLKQIDTNLNIFQAQGLDTLDMIRKQNKFLKGVRKKVIDMYNYIGLSSSLVDTIKKTHKQNLIIVIVGIILSLLFFYVMYSYFKK